MSVKVVMRSEFVCIQPQADLYHAAVLQSVVTAPFYALTESAGKVLVAELVPDTSRGVAYGLYSASIGVMALATSLIAGMLWTRVSPAAPFAFGVAMAFLAFVALHFVPELKMASNA